MRILFFTSQFPNSIDARKGIYNLSRAKALRNRNNQIIVIAPIGLTPPMNLIFPYPRINALYNFYINRLTIPSQETLDGFKIFHPMWFWLPRKIFVFNEVYSLQFCIGKKIKKIILKYNPDIIITSWLHPFGTYAKFIKKYIEKPIICYAEGSDLLIYPSKYAGWDKIKSTINRFVDKTIIISRAMDKYSRGKSGLKNTKLIVDGYDEDLFYFRDYPSSSNNILLSIGSLIQNKGHDILIKTMALLGNMCKLKIIGIGPEKKNLEFLAKKLGIEENIEFLGYIPHEKLINYINNCKILCMPSRSDAQPAAALEALACGRPLVATDVGGFRDIIKPGFNGFLCKTESPNLLAEAIKKALDTNWDHRKIAGWTKDNYGWNKSINELLLVIDEVKQGNSKCSHLD